MKKEIEDRLRKIMEQREELVFIKNNFSVDADISSLGINSFMFIKLIIDIENEFEIEFDDDDLDMENLNTFSNLIDYIEIQISNTTNG